MTEKTLRISHFYNADGSPFYEIVRYVPMSGRYATALVRSPKAKDAYKIQNREELIELRDTIDEALAVSAPTLPTVGETPTIAPEPQKPAKDPVIPDDFVIDLSGVSAHAEGENLFPDEIDFPGFDAVEIPTKAKTTQKIKVR